MFLTIVMRSYNLLRSPYGRLSRAVYQPSLASAASRLAKVQSTFPTSPDDEVGESGRESRSVVVVLRCKLDFMVARLRCFRTSSGLLNRKTWCSPVAR